MGKNARIIIFSLIGLAVLGGVTAVLMLTAPEKKEPEQTSGFVTPVSPTENVELVLCDRDEQDVASVQIANAEGSYEIIPSGNTDAEGKIIWTIADISSVPLDTASLSAAVGNASSFEAREFAETVSDSSELAKYGLDEPYARVKTVFNDGTEFSFAVGADVPNTVTSVYVTADGENVYTAYKSRMSDFGGDMYSFVDRAATPAYDQNSGEEVQLLTIERADLEEPLVIESITPEDEDSVFVFSYRMLSPYSAYLDLQNGAAFMYGVFGINASKVFSVDITEEDYAEYGLDKPSCRITAETNKAEYVVTVGAPVYQTVTNEDGTESTVLSGCYGISNLHPGILYLFDVSQISSVSVDPQKLLSRLFLMPYIYDVDTIDYSDNTGRKLKFGIDLIQKAEDNKDEIVKVTVNGEECAEQQFKNLYQYLISAAGEELYFDDDKGELIAEIVYNYKDRSDGVDGKDTVRLYSSDEDRKVIIELNGENIFKTRQMYATQLLANIGNFLDGQEIVMTY